MPLQINGFKVCSNSSCTRLNPQSITNFNKDKNNGDGLTTRCKHCNSVKTVAWRKANREKCKLASNGWRKSHPEKMKIRAANKQLQRLYGIILEQKQQMFYAQNGKCANLNCEHQFINLSDAHVDHDHNTNAVRGLLCGSCNRALGLLKDNVERVIGLADYRQKYSVQ